MQLCGHWANLAHAELVGLCSIPRHWEGCHLKHDAATLASGVAHKLTSPDGVVGGLRLSKNQETRLGMSSHFVQPFLYLQCIPQGALRSLTIQGFAVSGLPRPHTALLNRRLAFSVALKSHKPRLWPHFFQFLVNTLKDRHSLWMPTVILLSPSFSATYWICSF